MKCLTPIRLTLGGQFPVLLPCGKCDMCLRERQKEWCTRLMCEVATLKGFSKFVTLTYDDEFLPENGNLKHEDVQKYIKRVRKNSKDKLKYFVCGEYGEQTYRPHYHLIVFHNNVDTYDNLKEDWKMGHVVVANANIKTMRYVLKYIDKQKKLINYIQENKLVRPYQRMSKGIGEEYIKRYEENLKKGYIIVNGFKYKIPRYYLKKSDLLLAEHKKRLEERENEKRDDSLSKYLQGEISLEEYQSKNRQIQHNIDWFKNNKPRGL